jgi:cbb3-type cytochrome oxidase maturation protein
MGEDALLYAFFIALCMGLGTLGIFIWAVLGNQMDDTEDIKFRILEEELNDE